MTMTIMTDMTPEWERYFLGRGARWGDLMVYDVDEMHEILSKPSRKEAPTLVEVVETVRVQKCLPCVPTKSVHTNPLQHSIERKVQTGGLVRCRSCSYSRHTSPPDDFSADQRAHCCAICQLSGGRKHGGRCQRIQIT